MGDSQQRERRERGVRSMSEHRKWGQAAAAPLDTLQPPLSFSSSTRDASRAVAGNNTLGFIRVSDALHPSLHCIRAECIEANLSVVAMHHHLRSYAASLNGSLDQKLDASTLSVEQPRYQRSTITSEMVLMRV